MDAPAMHDTSTDVVVVDVSTGPISTPPDASDVIQICYGSHRGGCHLRGESDGEKHGVVISIDATSTAHRAFLDLYRRILRTEIPLRVVNAQLAASVAVGESAGPITVDAE